MTTPLTFDPARPTPIELVLPVEGMTCASCVNRIERFLSRTPGVEAAAVNLATEQATVRFDPTVAGRAELVAAVEAAGYDVRPETTARDAAGADDWRPSRRTTRRERVTAGCCVEALVATAAASFHGRDGVAPDRTSRWRPSTG